MQSRREFLHRIGFLVVVPSLLKGNEVYDFVEEYDNDFVILYDTNAQALYMDGTLGPTTGVIKVDYILKNEPVTLTFWHGHGGKNHLFALTPEHYTQLKKLERVYLITSTVDGHAHKLFIEPVDPHWRVPGAQPVKVPKDPNLEL